ncbi:hypothetical protein C1631_007210 [Chryseobacterium phosphatilyticum]|uniref:Uncharacterized protein n=1 Tax=Chryseobacterium phosphatilyticum TaxID=475075 RepID=A0A316XLX4_9FLAO|nr:hypothetical protein [Chryseobacterium phosphatilyticum]PWN72378.1 hypothetical protein C1631_007210 [Chryseobacterium phosphatilyticum]
MGLFDFLFKIFKRKEKKQTNEVTFENDTQEEMTTVPINDAIPVSLEETITPLTEVTTPPFIEDRPAVSEEKTFTSNEDGKRFDLEFIEAFRRFHCNPTLDVHLTPEDDRGNVYPSHQAYGDLFKEWMDIQSKWDRMSLLYHFWDQSQFEKLEDWQVIERFVKDRYSKKALQYFEEKMSDKRQLTREELVSLSKLHRVLLNNPAAKDYIETAYKNHPDDDAVKVEYATVLHIIGNHSEKELSHQLFHEVLDKKIQKNDTDSVFDCFRFSEGYTDSSIFAMLYLMNTEADNDTWDYVAEEYYYCPVFRYEHAVQLAQTDNSLRALAKLTSLSQEFPWFRTALESTIGNIKSMRKQLSNPDFMEQEFQEFQASLKKLQ